MLQSILAVDSLAIQRSLTILEDRYRELREIGEKRLQIWEKEKAEAQKTVEELNQLLAAKADELEAEKKERAAEAERVKALETELTDVKGQRDAQEMEKEEALKKVELKLLQLHQVQEELEHYFL